MCWTGYLILNVGQTFKNNSQITFKFCVQGTVLKNTFCVQLKRLRAGCTFKESSFEC